MENEPPYPRSVFGRNLTEHSGITELMDDLGEAFTSGRGRLRMMGGGNPGHIPEMQAIWRERMTEMLRDTPEEFDRMLADYDQPAGSPRFRDAVAGFLKREYGWSLTRDNIAVTNGGQTAFFFLLNRFAGPMADGGEKKILLPIVPEYIGYGDQGVSETRLFDARRPKIELIGERRFKYRIDFENLDLDDRHGAVAVSRPTNPSSNVLTDGEVSRLRALAAERRIPLILDNAYGLPFPGAVFVDATPVWDENIVLTLSLSKLGLPGTRTGIVVASEEIIREIRSMTAIVGLANNNVGQALARPMIESGRILELAEKVIRPFYRKRAELAQELAREHLPPEVPWRVHDSEGAFFLWFWFDKLPIGCRELYRRLKAADLLVVPGEYFFYGLDTAGWEHADQCIRVSFTQPEEVLADGFRILGEVIREVYRGTTRRSGE
ncbi:MAG: valine--pyruvate transaminase [Verrucomicrobiales bacterium]